MRSDFWGLPYSARMVIRNSEHRNPPYGHDAVYWRKSYEDLVKQTGRDLNDGLGLDPRKRATTMDGI